MLEGHTDEIFSAAFNYEGDTIITGSKDRPRPNPNPNPNPNPKLTPSPNRNPNRNPNPDQDNTCRIWKC